MSCLFFPFKWHNPGLHQLSKKRFSNISLVHLQNSPTTISIITYLSRHLYCHIQPRKTIQSFHRTIKINGSRHRCIISLLIQSCLSTHLVQCVCHTSYVSVVWPRNTDPRYLVRWLLYLCWRITEWNPFTLLWQSCSEIHQGFWHKSIVVWCHSGLEQL